MTDLADISVNTWAARITERWRASVESIFETGRLLTQAKDDLPHGAFAQMCEEKLPFGQRTAQRLMAIAEDKRLSNPTHVSHLPASWGTLAELTKLTDEELNTAFEQKIISPDMIRADVEQIRALSRPQHSDGGRENQPEQRTGPHRESGETNSGETGDSELTRSAAPPSEAIMPSGGLAIAHPRVESADSLDFFPTPPWATRALFERVFHHLDHLKFCKFQSVWEPACGEGHMSHVLLEYFRDVFASDAVDYGDENNICDFLTTPRIPGAGQFDWIITNPPFNDSIDFVQKALKRAGTGVAMFVRLTWLESVGRYEKIFRDQPPTLVAIFAERVPLHKGRWEENGVTMTAYIWLVWIKGAEPRAPFWIPPGCRESLSRPEDIKKFGKAIVEGEAA